MCEAARRAQCVNNLKQLGVAIHSYEASYRSFPLNWGNPRVDPARGHPWYIGGRPYSALTRLLPYLEQQPLYASINFGVETFPNDDPFGFPFPQNSTAYGTRLAIYLCPSDPVPSPSAHASNYRGNYGVGPFPGTTHETYDSGNGFYSFPGVLGSQAFPDGLSHTLAYSERLRGTGDGNSGIAPARDFGNISVADNCTNRDADYAPLCCRLALTIGFPAYRGAGFAWFFGDFECTAYNHAQEPDGRIPDAITSSGWVGIATARSLHPGGVNGLVADGSVRFFQSSMARQVWRASEHGTEASSSSDTPDRLGSFDDRSVLILYFPVRSPKEIEPMLNRHYSLATACTTLAGLALLAASALAAARTDSSLRPLKGDLLSSSREVTRTWCCGKAPVIRRITTFRAPLQTPSARSCSTATYTSTLIGENGGFWQKGANTACGNDLPGVCDANLNCVTSGPPPGLCGNPVTLVQQ